VLRIFVVRFVGMVRFIQLIVGFVMMAIWLMGMGVMKIVRWKVDGIEVVGIVRRRISVFLIEEMG
jgi:hypothetical protein